MTRALILALAFAAVLAARPTLASDGHGDEHGDEHGADESELLRVAPEMRRDLTVRTAVVETRSSGAEVEMLGQLQVNEDAYAEVGPLMSARVIRLHVGAGDRVAAGAPLAELESLDLGRARASYIAAAAHADAARRAAERERALGAERIAPEREVEQAKAEAAAALAEQRAAAAALRAFGVPADEVESGGEALGRMTLRAPLAGTVLERTAAVGRMADPAQPLFRVADLATLWLIVNASEAEGARLTTGAPARVALPALPGQAFTGTVAHIGSQVDRLARTLPVRIALANADGRLRPGMTATAWIGLDGEAAAVVAVPAAALQRVEETWVVFVPRADDTFEIRHVGRGRDLGGEVEVLSGLRRGETIVTDGAFLLKAEVEKAHGGGEHHHH